MTESNNDFERWAHLIDKQALGETLSPDEEAFCERFGDQHPAADAELNLYAELSRLSVPPDDASRELVDTALARLEAEDAARALAEVRMFRRRRVPGWLAATGLVAVACVVTLALLPKSTPDADLRNSGSALPLARAELVYASGEVTTAGGAATVGRTMLTEGSVVETGDGAACLLLDPDINVCLAARSRLRLSKIRSPQRTLELEAGRAATRLVTQPEGMSLSIVADGVTSMAVGTAFSVERGEDAVVTTVLHGKVRVGRTADRGRIVNAHEQAVTGGARKLAATKHGEPPTVAAVSRSEEAPSWALLGPTALWHNPVAATLEVRGEPEAAEALLDDQPIGVSPLSSLIPVGSHTLTIRKDGRVLLQRTLHVSAGESLAVTYEPEHATALPEPVSHAEPVQPPKLGKRRVDSSAKSSTKPSTKTSTKPSTLLAPEIRKPPPEITSAAVLLQQARRFMREGRYAQAAGAYEELTRTHPSSEEAHTVLVSLGQLRLSQLSQPQAALGSFEAYLARGGALAEEARFARIRALRALSRTDDEAAAIVDFLGKHPRSLEAQQLRARLDTLQAGE